MKCKDFEQDIYLYAELSETERLRLDAHIQECADCKKLFQLVSSVQGLIAKESSTKHEVVNNGRLTSNIMQAVAGQQKQSTSWMSGIFVKYAMATASLVLIIAFGSEQLSSFEDPEKTIHGTKTVTLNSASLTKALLDKKEKREPDKTSLYACVKSGDCDNNLIENFKKKSL